MAYLFRTYFVLTQKRWGIVFIVLLFSNGLLKSSIEADWLPEGETLSALDFFFAGLTQPFMLVFILPLAFCYLIGDIIMMDYADERLSFIFSRLPHRVRYLFLKIALILALSFLFFVLNGLSLVFIVFLSRLPFNGFHAYYIVTQIPIQTVSFTFGLFATHACLFLLLFLAIGLLYLLGTLVIRHVMVSYVLTAFLIFQAHGPIFEDHHKLLFCFLAQGVLSLHMPYYLQGGLDDEQLDMVKNFTVSHSIFYLMAMIVFLVGICWLIIRKRNFALKSS